MSKRGGVMWGERIRYLTKAGTGLIEFDYLPSDKIYQDDHSATAIAAAGCSTGTILAS